MSCRRKSCWSLVPGPWSLVPGQWSMIIDHWWLIIDRWSLIDDHWSMILDHLSIFIFHWSFINCHFSLSFFIFIFQLSFSTFQLSNFSFRFSTFNVQNPKSKKSTLKSQITIFNFEFQEALKKPLDLPCSNVKGALLASETRFWCSERGAKKRQKQKIIKFGRSAKSVGGSGRCRARKGRQTKKAERASWATAGESKR